ncbi:MAG: HAD family phosphatase [Anaerobutyricum sp.]|nr:HAD family phosphatase [Eubacterium sp.]MDY6046907.1 HAD family phosphatase [Anaerobutyricum sp.]
MKTLIFDLGMVLVDFRWKAFLEDLGYDEDQVENLAGAVFKNPLWQQFDWGIMGDENVLAQMKLEAPKYETDIERIWDNFRYVCQPYSYSEELIRTLHEKGYKIYFLSNYGETLFHRGKQDYAFFKYLDGGVFSYEVQQMKPNDDIYQTLLDRYHIDPENALFFDDTLENCEAARANGITAVQVKGLESILDGLLEHCQEELPEIRTIFCTI